MRGRIALLRLRERKDRLPVASLFSTLSISLKFTILLVMSAAFSTIKGYAEMMQATRVRERALFLPLRMPSELELQARWFAGDFGKQFVMPGGDQINVIQFGTWNREAGPDFREAAISINGAEPIRGCIEFDLADRNWETHGHATNPAFEDTLLHVFIDKSEREFFSRTRSNREVQQLCVDPGTLPENFSATVPLARPGRCQAPLRDSSEDRVRKILSAAAQFRLQQKAARIRRKIDSHGRDEALFQEIAAALGYKQNKLPFTLLAQRLPLKLLRDNIDNVEGLLFGLAGFLQMADLDIYKKSTREYVRQLWDRWWPHREMLNRLILPAKLWRLSSSRPLNHPQRRVASLALLVSGWRALQRTLTKRNTSAASDFFSTVDHPFWKFHYTLTAPASGKPMALIGESRIADILVNIFFPFWFAEGGNVATLWSEYMKLPARLTNRRVEIAAVRLFGGDPKRAQFLKTAANQQALLQIYEDFCMQDASDCAQCPFPEQMAKWT
jgi:hypothetical protein